MIIVEYLHHINIFTKDLEESINFYTNLLDFELISKESNHAIVSFDSTPIRLNLEVNPIPKQNYPIMSFILDEDDFTEAIQELEDKNITIIKGPDPIEKGEQLLIKDPGENIIEFYYKETNE